MLWLCILACTSPTDSRVGPDPHVDSAPEDTGTPLDSVPRDDTASGQDTADTPPVVTDESIGDQPEPVDDAFFDDGVIHDIAITLPADAIASLDAEPYTKVIGDIRIDGMTMPDVGVRLRDKIGSFRTLAGKPKFAVDINFTHEDQRYLGIEELSLNNEVVDCGYMKEPLAYKLMREAGVPAGRTSFARVTVNGASYGLYVIVETPDDRFLKRNFVDPSGNLYDGKYVWYGDYNYTLLDFWGNVANLFQLEEGVDVGHEDIWGIVYALHTASTDSTWYDGVNAVADLHAFTTYIAVEELVGHNDGYAMDTNNYRVYFDPENAGRGQMIPWDFDYAFLHDYDWGFSWATPSGRLANACFSNPQCLAEYKTSLTTVLDALDAPALHTWYGNRVALISDDAAADVRRECSGSNMLYYQSYVDSWIDTEPPAIRSYWGL